MTLQERRLELNLSLGDLARRVRLTRAQMSMIECGRAMPSGAVIDDIAAELQWTSEEVRTALPDREAVEAEDKRFETIMIAMTAARTEAKRLGFKVGRGGRGSLVCPVCGGQLRFSVAAVNGHLWGSCSTPDCVKWMQ